ncbi:MAG: hypothetical protein ACREXP_20220 [Steroidobacteraceae bacterium]
MATKSDALTTEQQESDALGFYEPADFAETRAACWGIGPLEVCVTQVAADYINVEIKLAGIKIGSGSLTAGHNSVCASANVGLVKTKLCVTADFPNRTVWVEGQLCTRKWSGGWSCRGFKTKILAW